MKNTVLPRPFFGLLAVLSLICSGCRTTDSVSQEPSVSLHSVEITGMGPEGLRLLCRLNVENPNSVPLPFPEIGWELFINSGSFLSGLAEAGEPLKAGGLTVLELPLYLGYGEILDTFKFLKGRESLDYHIDLETRFLLPVLGERIRRFEYQGKIPLLRMITFRNPSLRIEKLDFEGAGLVCSLDIGNPNPFPLPFPAIGYSYTVRNSSFITGTAEFPGSLAAEGSSLAEIRLRVPYSGLYQDFPALRTAGEAAGLLSLDSLVSLPGFGEERFRADLPGSLPLLKEPALSFRGISVKNIGLSKIDFEFGWDLDNPNGFGFWVEDIEYSLVVNNHPWARGKLAGQTDIAPGRKASIPAAVSLSDPAVVKDLTDIITRGTEVGYELSGAISYGSSLRGFSQPPIPFRLNGRTRLLR